MRCLKSGRFIASVFVSYMETRGRDFFLVIHIFPDKGDSAIWMARGQCNGGISVDCHRGYVRFVLLQLMIVRIQSSGHSIV